jgi:5-formyltetrahydrofolate cyclo-ligase
MAGEQMANKLKLRTWAKAHRATLPDVSSLVCGHLVWWLEARIKHGLDSQAGEHTVRPYTNPQPLQSPVQPSGWTGAERSAAGEKPPRQQLIVLSYKAFGTEISLETLSEHLPHFQFLTTRVAAQHTLTLHGFSNATQKNRYGILEPPPDSPEYAPETVDIALIPGLAFTQAGGRLGYGGGFYDRLLPQLRPDCLLVGITHSRLLLPELPLEPHDTKMQFLALETGVVSCA